MDRWRAPEGVPKGPLLNLTNAREGFTGALNDEGISWYYVLWPQALGDEAEAPSLSLRYLAVAGVPGVSTPRRGPLGAVAPGAPGIFSNRAHLVSVLGQARARWVAG